MKKIIWTFGIIAGVILVTMLFLAIPFMDDPGSFAMGKVVGYTVMTIALSTVFFAVKMVRDKEKRGFISFKNAFLTGLYVTLIASVMYAIGWEVIYQTSQSDFMEKYTQAQIENMREDGASEAKIEAKREEMEYWSGLYENPIIRFGFTLIEILTVGLPITLLSALILKRRENGRETITV